ncbi:amidohydrolase family protein [Hyphomonas johnsonii]|uniref:Amidohydrolase family protein n=1 Tax=Hyphomonas johnsonii MHS-2 TaxID=1280950 RepID=A0A059FTW4_9PROT|nr:amidohydrolase family protein [Hyphomonas johnsonii]KCZ94099.1 amidohydrolase family protein [Hyphomonas johnsonii MHS-2]
MLITRFGERRKGNTRLASLAAVAFLGVLCACVQGQVTEDVPVRQVVVSKAYTDGVSGRPPVPVAKTGQTLPMEPARRIRFETTEGTALALDVAPDGASIIFDMLGDLYRLPIAGGVAEPITSGMALDTQPVFSPDGSSILFLSDRSGAENIWLMDADGTNLRQISYYDDDPTFVSPEWAPDGQSILVSRYWAGRNAYELWRFKAVPGDMGEVVRSTDTDDATHMSSLGAAFAADGASIFLASLSGASPSFEELSAWEIIRRDTATGEETAILPTDSEGDHVVPRFRPAASPDGRYLAFAERRQGKTRLNVLELATGDVRWLADLDPDSLEASLWHDAIPRYDFTPDSAHLIVNREGHVQAISVETGDIQAIPFTATIDQGLGTLARHQAIIEDGPVIARLIQAPSESPDGKQVAFSALGHIYIQNLTLGGKPRRLTSGSVTGYHPAWSADGDWIASVSWTNADGGAVWITSADGKTTRKLDLPPAFYTHPVFTPAGDALLVIRSPAQVRRETYMEYGQLRDADLLHVPLDGAETSVLMSGRIGGTPHFRGRPDEVLVNTDEGVKAISLVDSVQTDVTEAVGPNWYFASEAADADDLRVSPDGRWALAQITQQLHLYKLDEGRDEPFDLSAPSATHVQLTEVGADYFGWSADGQSIHWADGATYYRLPLDDVAFERGRNESAAARYSVMVEVPRDAPVGDLLLRGGSVIPMTDRNDPGKVLANTDILVRDNRIVSITKAGETGAGPDVPTVDVNGKYIIPGLIDAHYHVADIRRDVLDTDVWGLRTGLAYGVTTLFDPSSLTVDMLAYEDLVESGEVIGSRLFTTGTAVFNFNDFRSRDQVRSVLSRYRDHYRLSNLKQYLSGNRRVRQWVSEVADELGLTVTTEGPLSFKLGLTLIIDGYSGVEHAMAPVVHYRDLTEFFAQSETSNTLTLMITHGGLPADKVYIARTDPLSDAKYANFAPAWFRESRFRDVTADAPEDYLYPLVAKSSADMFRAGGVVGLGAHGNIPGFGTHWEMQAYVEGGWTPAEVLWAATMGNARTIGRDQALGSLIPGKLADLVVLDENPLDDISHTLAIHSVMKNGRLYDDETLEEIPAVHSSRP